MGDVARLVCREIARPQPGPGQVLIRIGACGVCRTDLHVVDGDLPNPKPGIVPGHEIIGRIEALGAGVDRFGPGVRVACPGWAGPAGAAPIAGADARISAPRRLHRLPDRRRVRRVRCRRRALLPSARRGWRRCGRGAAALRRPHRLSRAAHGRRGQAPWALRLPAPPPTSSRRWRATRAAASSPSRAEATVRFRISPARSAPNGPGPPKTRRRSRSTPRSSLRLWARWFLWPSPPSCPAARSSPPAST